MSREIVLGLDVGATNTRASVGVLSGRDVLPHPEFPGKLTTEVSSKHALYDFIVSVLRLLEDTDVLEAATLAVAGPIERGIRARMTNWRDVEPIELTELEALGLPRGRTSLVNDLFAGARGLTAWLATRPARGLATLRSGRAPEGGNLVFVAPGTGLGAAGIVRLESGEYMPIGCEAQHTLLPAFDDDSERVIAHLSAGGGRPSWEDVASGVGLTRAYDAYCAFLGCPSRLAEGGSRAVAEAARAGSDSAAVAALDLYYRVIGRFAQMLALAFLPCSGVYFGGASTAANREFIERSGLVEHFLSNRAQGRLLGDVPLHLVLEEVNLDGALGEAARIARSHAVTGA